MAKGGNMNENNDDTKHFREEMRFVKDQQWKLVYYPLLLFSVIIIIFSNNIINPSKT